MSAPSLSNFSAQLRKRNIARPNLYYVEIVAPGESNEISSLVSMWCASAQTPQIDVLTNDSYLENGTKRKYAYDVEYQNLVLTFYIDQDFKVKKFFDDWNQKVIKNKRHFSYPDDYTADKLNLFILNQNDIATYQYQYNRIYPKTIQSVELSYANGNVFSTVSIEFVYETVFTTAFSEGTDASTTSAPTLDLTNNPNAPLNNEVLQNLIDIQTFFA